MLELCGAAQEAFGSRTWSAARIDRLSGALLSLTTGADGEGIDWVSHSSDDLRMQIDVLADCPPLVGALKDAVDAVGLDLSEIGVTQAKVFLLRVPLIIARNLPDLAREFVLAIGEEGLDLFGDLIADDLEWAQDRIDEAEEALERLTAELVAAIQAIEDAIEALQHATHAELRSIKTALSSCLNDDAFADLRAAALRAGHLNTSDMSAAHTAVLQSVYSDQERAALKVMPLNSGTSF